MLPSHFDDAEYSMDTSPSHPLAHLQHAAGQLHQHFARTLSQAFAANRPKRVLKQHLLSGGRSAPRRVTFHPPLAAIIPGDSVVEQVFTTGIQNFLGLYNTALVVRLVLTWFPSPPAFIVGPLSTLCDPYLNLFRGIIPPLGGTLDFSPILAFVLLSVFTNTAAALPCELGPDDDAAGRGSAAAGESSSQPGSNRRPFLDWLPASKYQLAWAQRVNAAKQQ